MIASYRFAILGGIFGFLWGIPIPVFMLYIDTSALDIPLYWDSIKQIIQSRPLHMFFLFHPVLFALFFGSAGYMLDIIHHKNTLLLSQLEQKAMTDGLTMLYNHSAFFKLLNEELERLTRGAAKNTNENYITLIMMDVDHFKKINDRFGHQAGDRILKQFSEILQKNIRQYDHACRYGGDEFTIIMPGVNPSNAYSSCERIQSHVLSELQNSHLQISISIGIASWQWKTGQPIQAKDFIELADTALYTAKNNGRNRIEIISNDTDYIPPNTESFIDNI